MVNTGIIPKELGDGIIHYPILYRKLEELLKSGVEGFLDSMPLGQRNLLIRSVASREILKKTSTGHITDKRLTRWLERVLSGFEGCKKASFKCLFEELSGRPDQLESLLYGLARLQDMVFVEKSINFLGTG